jgi:hypothetical protein
MVLWFLRAEGLAGIMQKNQIANLLALPEVSRRGFLRTTGQLGLAALISSAAAGRDTDSRAQETNGNEYAMGEVILPFAYAVSRSPAPKPAGLDFSHQYGPDNCEVFIRIDGELWEFRSQWITNLGTTARYKGPDVDHLTRVEDGTYPDGMTACWFLGGMWYDEADRKLYAPMHVEQDGIRRDYPGCRKIALATSTDKGRSWKYEGDIITSETYYYSPDFSKFSGSSYGSGVADFGLYVDTRGGYIYVFPDEGWTSRATEGAMRWNSRAARCAISDKMAPGKWKYFYNGTWDEPALGGKSSTVAPGHLWGTVYSTRLEKYICMFIGNQDPPNQRNIDGVYIGACTDLGKQDWVWGYCPEAMFGFFSLLNAEGTNVASVCDDSFRMYSYWSSTDFQRLDIKLSPGRTVSTDVQCRYLFEPHPESSDPILGRVTKIVGSASPEMKYAGSWVDRLDPLSYEGRRKESAGANSSVEFSFVGGAVYWRALRSPASGKAEVYIDGVFHKAVDCYSPRSTTCEEFLYLNTGLAANSRHTIKIVVSGKKHPKSESSAISHIAFEYAAESYKASAGFSGLMGKNNWYYQQWNGARYADLGFTSDPAHPRMYWFGKDDCKIGVDYQVAGDSAAVRRWVAPHGGVVRVEGTVDRGAAAEDATVSIFLNTQNIWPESPAGRVAAHDLPVTVVEGDSLAFVVGRKDQLQKQSGSESVKVTWNPVITYTKSVSAVGQLNSPSDENLARGKYARSKFLVSSYRPFDAVDANLNTAFIIHSDDKISSGDDWFSVDLEKTYVIDRYTLTSQTQNPGYRPLNFILQKSDDGFTWTDVHSVTNPTGEQSTIDCIPLLTVQRDVPAFRARYVRLYLPNGKPFVINEFGLYYTEGKSSFGAPIPSGSARLPEEDHNA